MCSSRASLEDRLKLEEHSGTSNMDDTAVGSKQLTFTLKKVKCSRGALSSVSLPTRSHRCIVESNEVQIESTVSAVNRLVV